MGEIDGIVPGTKGVVKPRVQKKHLFIDPSLTATGWAVFSRRRPRWWGCIVTPNTLGFKERLKKLNKGLVEIYNNFEIKEVVIEINTAPYARNVKAIIKYQVAVGVVIGTCMSIGWKVRLVEASEWKGRETEQDTADRVQDEYELEMTNKDILTAIGIGHWYFNERQEG